MEIVVATKNLNKVREIGSILSQFGMTAISRDDAGIPDFNIEETGTTFEENSFIKADSIRQYTTKAVIADDSGLEVDFLNGAPGVYSARYADVDGENADAANNKKLLKELKDVPAGERRARFVSVITILFPDGRKIAAKGTCEGTVAEELMGDNGFGYDPLFIPDGHEQSFAQLHPDEKNKISHRGKALGKLKEKLKENE